MNLDNQNLEWKLCEAYFSILEISMSSDISLDKLCVEAKISKEEVETIIPNNPMDHRIFFLKIIHLCTFSFTEINCAVLSKQFIVFFLISNKKMKIVS